MKCDARFQAGLKKPPPRISWERHVLRYIVRKVHKRCLNVSHTMFVVPGVSLVRDDEDVLKDFVPTLMKLITRKEDKLKHDNTYTLEHDKSINVTWVEHQGLRLQAIITIFCTLKYRQSTVVHTLPKDLWRHFFQNYYRW